MKNLNKLTHLKLYSCNQIIDEAFKNLNKLIYLELWYCNQITDETFKNLIEDQIARRYLNKKIIFTHIV